MLRKGLIRNRTNISQGFGLDVLPPNAIGLVDFEVVRCFKDKPNKDFEVIEENNFIFVRTPHKPFNARYMARKKQ
jgi:hypothetical protein